MPIRVLIVDDHALVRSGLRLLLETEKDVSVAGEGASGAEAVRLASLLAPDVVLLDLLMPGGSGLDALPELRKAAPASRVLVLSMQDDPGYVRAAFGLGAAGYLLKDAADQELISAVRLVATGGRYLDPGLGARLATGEAGHHGSVRHDPLSPRERDVLQLVALGHTNREIASTLQISLRSAEQHRSRLTRKLQLSSRAELQQYARDHGLLQAASPA